MYKIIFCSDLHGNEKLYNKLLDGAVKNNLRAIIIGGDICPHAHMGLNLGVRYQGEFIEKFLFGYFREVKEKNIELYIMMGNDDFRINSDLLENCDLIRYLHNKLHKISNKSIIGYSFVPQMPFLLKDWEKLDIENSKQITPPHMDVRTLEKEEGTIEDDIKKIRKLSNPDNTIYVFHSPPYDTNLDITLSGKHVGSRAIKEFINKEQPPLTLHGHIHESFEMGSWKDKIGKTICLNAGSDHLNSRLNYVIIDLDNLKDIKHFSV